MICFAMALILHFGGAIRPLIVLMKSGLYLSENNSPELGYWVCAHLLSGSLVLGVIPLGNLAENGGEPDHVVG